MQTLYPLKVFTDEFCRITFNSDIGSPKFLVCTIMAITNETERDQTNFEAIIPVKIEQPKNGFNLIVNVCGVK